MLESLQGLHIEPTNICTLKCPRCSRTEFINQFPRKWTNKNLNLEDLKKFLDIDLSGKYVLFNGNYGDPLYYPDLIEAMLHFKSLNCKIIIYTNGSYVPESTWHQLVQILDEHDIINFSIDGIPDNFTKYRINANWASIKKGIDIVTKSKIKTVWKYIVFSYNLDTIKQAEQLSKDLGITEFIVNNSDRWIDNDWLNPQQYVDVNRISINGILPNGSFDGKRENSIIDWKMNNRNNEVDPLCKITHSMHYISADGFYMPCCWTGDHRFYYQSEFYKNQEQFNIANNTLTQVLQKLENFYNSIETNKPKYCTFNCPKL